MLKLSNINKSFPENFEPVLKGIDLELKSGDFCIIVGANGSGKSTLMKVISGEYNADKGSVFINGTKCSEEYVAQVVQDVNKGTIPEMNLLENIALSQTNSNETKLSFYKRKKSEVIEKVRKLGIGLEEYIDQPLANLSGGQRQIIATLMAINSAKHMLLLDEHTSALDPRMQVMLMEYTAKAISKLKLTTLMITHKMDDAIKYGNRLIMLHKGQIVFDVKGAEKASLTVNKLLALFHKYEDLNLIGNEK